MKNYIVLFCIICVNTFSLSAVQINNADEPLKTVKKQNIYLDDLLISYDSVSVKINPSIYSYLYKRLFTYKMHNVGDVISVNNDLYFFSKKASRGFCLINRVISKRILELNLSSFKRGLRIDYFYNGHLILSKKQAKKIANLQLGSFRITGINVDGNMISVEIYDTSPDNHLKYSFYQACHIFPFPLSCDYPQTCDYVFQDNLLVHNNINTRCCSVLFNDESHCRLNHSEFISNNFKDVSIIKSRYDIQNKVLTIRDQVNIWMWKTQKAEDGYLYINDLVNNSFFDHYFDYTNDTIQVEYIYNNQKITREVEFDKLFSLRKKQIRVFSINNDLKQGKIVVSFTSDFSEYAKYKRKYIDLLDTKFVDTFEYKWH